MSLPGTSGGFWHSVRQLPDRTPLRVKLITAVLTLVAIALAAISFVGISVLKGYLLDQANAGLQSISASADHNVQAYLFGQQPQAYYRGTVEWLPEGGKLQVVAPGARDYGGQTQFLPAPAVETNSAWLAAHAGQPVTVPAESGGGTWLIAIYPGQPFQTPSGGVSGTVIVGVDVTSYYADIAKLRAIDLIVSAIVLVALAIVGVAVVRASLRPLAEIETTAQEIAAGDLSRRVPERDPRTEVGRLGRSLNAMLAQIEMAFRARTESEASARRSEERMRQFVADASHELRTPLTAIRGFAEYYRQRGGVDLSHGDNAAEVPVTAAPVATAASGANGAEAGNGRSGSLPPADLNRIMRRVEQESARMGIMVEDMLLLARMDQQRPLERQTVDLLTLAADAVHDARVVAPERSINLTVGSGAALLVQGDETRLRQVIGNLMTNALVHTREGTPIDVRIRSGSLDEGRGTPGAAGNESTARPRSAAVLEVADQGPGLTPEQAERVFERFYRADKARTSGGTGLGLAIVAALVSAHGGMVWVESPPAGGAIFRIALPLSPEALSEEEEAEAEAEPDDESPEPDQPVSTEPTAGAEPTAGPEPATGTEPAADGQPDTVNSHPGYGRRRAG
jgi:two-component system OmpR family sensor kinase